jgi:hypothetical protein
LVPSGIGKQLQKWTKKCHAKNAMQKIIRGRFTIENAALINANRQ